MGTDRGGEPVSRGEPKTRGPYRLENRWGGTSEPALKLRVGGHNEHELRLPSW